MKPSVGEDLVKKLKGIEGGVLDTVVSDAMDILDDQRVRWNRRAYVFNDRSSLLDSLRLSLSRMGVLIGMMK